jgi:hypothetical protein
MSGVQPVWWFFVSVAVGLASLSLSLVALYVSYRSYRISLERHQGLGPKSALKIELAGSGNSTLGLYSLGWMENPLVAKGEDDDEPQPPMSQRSRIPAYFARARVTNLGPFTASSITLSLTRIERLTDPKEPTDTVQPLRWSDSWSFKADRDQRTLNPTAGSTTLPSLHPKSDSYCDICFHHHLEGPKRLGRFRVGLVYFAVTNLPSHTYALGDGEYIVKFHLAGKNCEPLECAYKLVINLGIAEPTKRVRFEIPVTH